MFLVVSLLLASLGFPLALRGYSDEAITDEIVAPNRGYSDALGPGQVRWHTVGSHNLELLFEKGEIFIHARISF